MVLTSYNREYYQKHKEEIRKKRKLYRDTHPDLIKAGLRRSYQKHKIERNIQARKRYHANKDKNLSKQREYYQSLKKEVLTLYGGGKMACTKCGETRIDCLSIDHINGGGNKHRKDNKTAHGRQFYYQLRKNLRLDTYQTLCMNCQFIKRAKNKEWGKVK